MAFTITRKLDQVPGFSVLSRLAGQNQFRITGNDRNGLFSCRGVEGGYEFGADGINGTFAGHGVTGEFSFEIGKATVTINKKPFWVPETLLKQKIMESLDTLCNELAGGDLRNVATYPPLAQG